MCVCACCMVAEGLKWFQTDGFSMLLPHGFKKLISLLFQTFYKSGVKISRTEKHISGHSYLTGRKWKYAVNN